MKSGLIAIAVLLVRLLTLVGHSQPGSTGLPSAGRACTSFCLDNDGQSVFGTNYDNERWEGLLLAASTVALVV